MHLFPAPCQCSCHVAEQWTEKSPAGPSEAQCSPSSSSAARHACPPPGNHHQACEQRQRERHLAEKNWHRKNKKNNTEDFNKSFFTAFYSVSQGFTCAYTNRQSTINKPAEQVTLCYPLPVLVVFWLSPDPAPPEKSIITGLSEKY